MRIKIKTTLIELEIEDEQLVGKDNYTKRVLPELPECIKSAIDEAIKLHDSVYKSKLNQNK